MISQNIQDERNNYAKQTESVFEEIYFANFEKIKFYAHSYLRDQAQAQCVAQDVFLALWEKMDNNWEPRDVVPLLFVIAKYKCINILRRDSRDKQFKDYKKRHDEDSLMYATLSDFNSTSLYSKEVENLYSKALKAMPEQVRETFLFSRKGELKYREIADKQNISTKTVEYRVSYAFRILRKYLKDYLTLLI